METSVARWADTELRTAIEEVANRDGYTADVVEAVLRGILYVEPVIAENLITGFMPHGEEKAGRAAEYESKGNFGSAAVLWQSAAEYSLIQRRTGDAKHYYERFIRAERTFAISSCLEYGLDPREMERDGIGAESGTDSLEAESGGENLFRGIADGLKKARAARDGHLDEKKLRELKEEARENLKRHLREDFETIRARSAVLSHADSAFELLFKGLDYLKSKPFYEKMERDLRAEAQRNWIEIYAEDGLKPDAGDTPDRSFDNAQKDLK